MIPLTFSNNRPDVSRYDALNSTTAMIEFAPDGTIRWANDVFLKTMGYRLDDIVGRHHKIFVAPQEQDSVAYTTFWRRLAIGEVQEGEFVRLAKSGADVWLQAVYAPMRDTHGAVTGVVKVAADITDKKDEALKQRAQLAAVERTQAMIQFKPNGEIVTANERFLDAMGYRLDEIVGRHHSLFVDEATRKSADYHAFWDRIAAGDYFNGEFSRITKAGDRIVLRACYAPIKDHHDNIIGALKFATDITEAALRRERRQAVQASVDAELTDVSQSIHSVTETTAAAAAAASQTADTVQNVAAGGEELAASVSEIARQVTEAGAVAGRAGERAESARSVMTALSGAAQSISTVVALIRDIAEQTNLLALNATIEAARAGASGKGFAVVAQEVKALATQSAKATNDIAQQIDHVQTRTEDAVEAISDISQVIDQVNAIASAIAGAIEEQGAVTRDMASNMQVATQGVNAISENMEEIAQATRSVSQATAKVKAVSSDLAA
ncbi:MAG: PAS domain S-box protein [Maricaulaceae bacterium]